MITSDGTVVPEFTVTIRPVVSKPELLQRKHFKNGEFTLAGLKHDRYQIQISAKLYITSRLDFDFTTDTKATEHCIVILHTFRNEPRFVPGSAYKVSVKALQQKIPDAARASYFRGVDLHREGRLDEALVEYGNALRAYPQYMEALGDLGTIFILYNRPESALTFLRRAQAVDDCNAIVNLNIAIALTEQRDYAGALKLLRNVLHTDPEMGLAQYFIARVRYQQGRYDQAEEALLHAVQTQPRLLDAWLLLVNVSLEQKNYDQAREALTHIRRTTNNGMVSRFIDEQLSMFDSGS